MDLTHNFRRAMTLRLLQIAGAAALAAPVAQAAGCGGIAVIDPAGSGGAGGAPTGGINGTNGITTGYEIPIGDTVVSVGTSVVSVGTGPDVPVDVECLAWPINEVCPSAREMLAKLQQDDCTGQNPFFTSDVVGGPFEGLGACCYETITAPCGGPTGRPFLVAGRPLTAAVRRGDAGGWRAEGPAPCLAAERDTGAPALSAAQRGALAEAWTRDALMEHASVASFARFSLDLMAAGAPAELIEAAHRAALDEVRHARLCLALASAYGGEPIEPAAFPLGGSVQIAASLGALAAAAAAEGCIGETLAAVLAAEQLARASDPAVRAALAMIAEDEARHAELAFRTVAWALRSGGDEVRVAVAAVFAEAERHLPALEGVEDGDGVLAAHGRLDAVTSRAAAARGLAEVVLPCAKAMLASAGRQGALPLAAVSPEALSY